MYALHLHTLTMYSMLISYFKKFILLSMFLICIGMFIQLMISIYQNVHHDIVTGLSCPGKVQLTCGEHWCKELCIPLSLTIQTHAIPNSKDAMKVSYSTQAQSWLTNENQEMFCRYIEVQKSKWKYSILIGENFRWFY